MKINHLNVTYTILTALIFALGGCNYKNQNPDSKALADTDRFYSALSAEKGMNTAFLAMFDSAAVMLKANHAPIEGYEAIKADLLSESDTSYILTWEPMFAKIAVSGEMGYTYGTFKVTDKATASVSGEGTYTTFWRKNVEGKWKAMLDTGNPGLGK